MSLVRAQQAVPSLPGGGVILLSAHARYARHTAQACGYDFRSLDGADGYLFEVRNGARSALFSGGAGSPYALNDARAAALARDKAFCAEVLACAGLAVVPGRLFFITKRWAERRGPGRELEDALRFGRDASYPLFCKPISGSNGAFAEKVDDTQHFADYLARAAGEHYAILAQPYIRAPEYRVFVFEGEALFSYRKSAPVLVGDGHSSVRRLNRNRPARARDLRGALLAPDAVLAAGERATIEGAANRALGGIAAEFRDGADAALAAIALAATGAIGLRLAGVDLFVTGDGPTIIEVNANPMIATLEDHGRWDLIEKIWRANFDAALR